MMDWKYEYNKYRSKFYLKLARKLPKRLQLWCFIVVYGTDGQAPSEEYTTKFNCFEDKHGFKL